MVGLNVVSSCSYPFICVFNRYVYGRSYSYVGAMQDSLIGKKG